MVAFDEELLKDRLDALTPWCRTVFALSCAERLFPQYKLFSEKTGQGSPNLLRSTLDELWETVLQRERGRELLFLKQYQSLLSKHDVERSKRTLLDPLADDAIAALADACECQLSGATQYCVWAALCSYETVDYMAHTLEGMAYDTPEGRAAILKREYVQTEIQRQLRDLVELESAVRESTAIEDVVETFRSRAKSEGRMLVESVSALCE